MLNKIQLHEAIVATGQNINLRTPMIEKDYYVTQAILAFASLENECFRLIFCGGTCLANVPNFQIAIRSIEDLSKQAVNSLQRINHS